MRVKSDTLKRLVVEIFKGAGSEPAEAEIVADHLVTCNLVGHDSHGVIRVLPYVTAVHDKRVFPNRHVKVVADFGALSILDADDGYGQVAGREALDHAADRSEKFGVGVVAMRACGHIGRVGAYAEQAAERGKLSLLMVNAPKVGGGEIAPFGGVEARLGSTPYAMSMPRRGKPPLLLDFATASVAMGKIRVARNRGERLPMKCIITRDGEYTDDPNAVYDERHGSVMPFGAHKGYALNVFGEVFAGLLSDGGTKKPGKADRIQQSKNNAFIMVIDPSTVGDMEHFQDEFRTFADFVTDAKRAPGQEILMPGDVEDRTRRQRLRDGIQLDDNTRDQLLKAAESVGFARAEAERLLHESA
ncbi:MAG: Ldh family oxidoreductase [Acetobacterales bacterium]